MPELHGRSQYAHLCCHSGFLGPEIPTVKSNNGLLLVNMNDLDNRSYLNNFC